MATNYTAEKESRYKTYDYERIFKPRGWTREANIVPEITAEKEIQRQEKVNKKVDDKAKLLIKNIEYWNDLANSITKTKY